MAKEKKTGKLGAIAFYAALLLAVLLAFMPGSYRSVAVLILALLGVVVGILNITDKETMGFLLACLAWIVGGNSLSAILQSLPIGFVGDFLVAILGNVVTFVAPAAALVALIHIYRMTKD